MKRMWLTATLFICGLAQAAFNGNIACAGDGARGAELLPKETLVFFSIPSIKDAKEQFDKSLPGALFKDKEFKPFLEDVKAKIGEASEKVQDEIGVSISDLLAVPQGEMTFAITETEEKKLSLVFVLDYGSNEDTVDKLLEKMHDALDGDVAEHATEEVGDVKIEVYEFKNADADNPFKTLAYFNNDTSLVFSSEVSSLKGILERWDGKSDDTLANNDVFKYVQERCKDESGAPLVVWHVNPIGLIQAGLNLAQSFAPQVGMAGPFLPMLGLDKLKGFGGAGYLGAGDFESVSKSFLYLDQPASGLVNVFQFPATELMPPKWVTADVGVYMGVNWNVAKAYQAIEGMVDMFQGRGALTRLMDSIATSGPGIHPKKDVLDLLDGKIHVVQKIDSKDDDFPLQMVVALDVKDAAKMKKTLSKVAKSSSAALETREFNGETIYEMETQGDQKLLMAVASSQLVITNESTMLERMLRTDRQPALVDSPLYRKISKFFPTKASMIEFDRSNAMLKAGYEALMNADEDALEGINLKKLPPFAVFEKYLRSSGTYTAPDKKGALTVNFQLREGDK